MANKKGVGQRDPNLGKNKKKPKGGGNKPSALMNSLLANQQQQPTTSQPSSTGSDFDAYTEWGLADWDAVMDNQASTVVNTPPSPPPVQPPPAPATPPPQQQTPPATTPTVGRILLNDKSVAYLKKALEKHYKKTPAEINDWFNDAKKFAYSGQQMKLSGILLGVYKTTKDPDLIPTKEVFDEVKYFPVTLEQFRRTIQERFKKANAPQQNAAGQQQQQQDPPTEGMFSRIKNSVLGKRNPAGKDGQLAQLGKALKFATFAAVSGRSVDEYAMDDRRAKREAIRQAEQEAAERQQQQQQLQTAPIQAPPSPAPSTIAPAQSNLPGSGSSSAPQQQPAPKIIVVPSSATPEQIEEEKKYKESILAKMEEILDAIKGSGGKQGDPDKKGGIGGWLLLIGGAIMTALAAGWKFISDNLSSLFSPVTTFLMNTLPSLLKDAFAGIKNFAGSVIDTIKNGWDRLTGRGAPGAPIPPTTSSTPTGGTGTAGQTDPHTGQRTAPTQASSAWKKAYDMGKGAVKFGAILSMAAAPLAAALALADHFEDSEEGKTLRSNQAEYNDNYNRVQAQLKETGKVSKEDIQYLHRNWDGSGDFEINNGKYEIADVPSIVRASNDPYKPAGIEPAYRVAGTGDDIREQNRMLSFARSNEEAAKTAAIINTPTTIVNNSVGGGGSTITPLVQMPTAPYGHTASMLDLGRVAWGSRP